MCIVFEFKETGNIEVLALCKKMIIHINLQNNPDKRNWDHMFIEWIVNHKLTKLTPEQCKELGV